MGRLLDDYAVIQAVDRHTSDAGKLDDDISIILEGVPPAFDKAKVIGELKKLNWRTNIQYMNQRERGMKEAYDNAVEIVEKGGAE